MCVLDIPRASELVRQSRRRWWEESIVTLGTAQLWLCVDVPIKRPTTPTADPSAGAGVEHKPQEAGQACKVKIHM